MQTVGVVSLGIVLLGLGRIFISWRNRQKIARAVSRKRSELAASLQRAQTWLSETGGIPREEDIRKVLEASASQLVQRQVEGSITAVELLRIFVYKALQAHKKTNCLAWLDVDIAATAAHKADERRRQGATVGPLHGLPISIKDCIDIAGTDSTAGMAQKCHCPTSLDAVTVSQVKDAGGIIFCKTNVPQTLLSFECINYVFGTGTNPVNADFSCGGSSGGEGALIALGGAVIGVGTDIGGSIRIPAHFCGIYGFKPTQWRVSTKGLNGAYRGQEAVPAVVGPMARSIDDLVTLVKVFTCDGSLRDGNVTPLPFRQQVFDSIYDSQQRAARRKLKYGFYLDDGFFAASPACQRAVVEAVAALRAQGHECVLIEPTYLGIAAVTLYYRLLGADGGRNLIAALGNEPITPHIKGMLTLVRVPEFVKRGIAKIVALRDPYLAVIIASVRGSTVQEYWQLQFQRQCLRDQAARLFAEQELDAIIAPALVTPAVPHGSSAQAQMGAMYTGLLNLLDMPSTVVPVTTVDASVDEWKDTTQHAQRPQIAKRIRAMYSPVDGLPVGVQVTTTKLNDETSLACAAVLDSALKSKRS